MSTDFAKKAKPSKYVVRLHRQGPFPLEVNTNPMSDERARRMAEGFATREGIKVELLAMRTREVVATFGAEG